MNILHLDSSILGANSASRSLTASIVARLKQRDPTATVTYHDLAREALPHLSGAHMAALRGRPCEDPAVAADLAIGDRFIAELFAADVIVVGAPMYNFTLPTQLKAWIDRIMIAGKTFRYRADGPPESLLPAGKKLYIVSSRGGAYSEGTPIAFLDHQETLLRGTFGFLGIDAVVIRAEGLSLSPDARAAAVAAAEARIAALAA